MDQDPADPNAGTPAASSLRDAFPGYFPPSEDDLRSFFTGGMVVFDTNALLNAYKLTGTARAEFLGTLEVLGDRLWIPHQVGLEFLRQRATVISQGSSFQDKFRQAAKDLHGQVQRLQEHRGLKDEDVSGVKKAIDAAIDDILTRFSELYDFGVEPGMKTDDDPVLARIEKITDGKIGPPLPNPAEAEKTGTQRLKNEIPPGYCDVKEKGISGALGDYFMWEQTLVEAAKRKFSVLLVTNDSKEDWVRQEGSYRRGPRPELVHEMLARSGQRFHLLDVKSFLFHAGRFLATSVSGSTIEQAETVQKETEFSAFRELERTLADALRRYDDEHQTGIHERKFRREAQAIRWVMDTTNARGRRDNDEIIAFLSGINRFHILDEIFRSQNRSDENGEENLSDESGEGDSIQDG
ncbi:PIN-like domain-containing protein [Acrocarpospora catenulata]|uniref:PIN-like domain-containing protein n=1 Tax=Acrocarpospora catenulata TaxID=2836182 RepID=UPI001BD9C15B|nr:PIN domain-containing protein [Acrocarpospora catenulata]